MLGYPEVDDSLLKLTKHPTREKRLELEVPSTMKVSSQRHPNTFCSFSEIGRIPQSVLQVCMPIRSMHGPVYYLPAFTTKIKQMEVNIPYMDPTIWNI